MGSEQRRRERLNRMNPADPPDMGDPPEPRGRIMPRPSAEQVAEFLAEGRRGSYQPLDEPEPVEPPLMVLSVCPRCGSYSGGPARCDSCGYVQHGTRKPPRQFR